MRSQFEHPDGFSSVSEDGDHSYPCIIIEHARRNICNGSVTLCETMQISQFLRDLQTRLWMEQTE